MKLTCKQVPMACSSGATETQISRTEIVKQQSTKYTLSMHATHSLLLN